jgi:hypothetical protein
MSYGEALSQMRAWLNNRKMLQPATFKLSADGRIGLEICFRDEGDAMTFGRFRWS